MRNSLIGFGNKTLLLITLLLLSNVQTFADNQVQAETATAPGYGKLNFQLPNPDTYTLPKLGSAADGQVLDSKGNTTRLHSLMGGKVTLLSFIYAACSDVNGCPLATWVFHKIHNRLQQEPELAAKIRLLTLSFNPKDTPEVMAHYGEGFKDNGIEWHFLTTASEQALQPILQSYRQPVQKIYDANGKDTGTYAHTLRVYLIDDQKQLRNIYSVSFLHPDTLVNDIKTLLRPQTNAQPQPAVIQNPAHYSAGDDKTQYETENYQTHSLALTERVGKPADLLKTIRKPPLGLPRVPVPNDNPLTRDKISLGRKLFYDRRLSLNNTFSCAMCHIPEQGFTSNEMATAVGVEGRTVRRNSPTLYNVAYAEKLFHDSRESTLEQQVWGPLLAHNEMANPSIGYVLDKINQNKDYPKLFKKVFGEAPNMANIGKAIASYERALNSANSAFDHWYFGKQNNALDEQAKRGFALFSGKANCASCHQIGKTSALFTDNANHNTGIGYRDAMAKTADKQRVQVAPGVYLDVATTMIDSVSTPKANDLGRYEITQNPADRWQYKTPSLRNIALTAPYMHNGSLQTLEQVVEFYNRGGVANENLDPLIKPLNLSAEEMTELTAFLRALTGDNIKELVADGFAAPVGDSD